MSKHNRYKDGTTHTLISKIDAMIKKSQTMRNQITDSIDRTGMRGMRGGSNINPKWVAIDSEAPFSMTGGSNINPKWVAIDSEAPFSMTGGSNINPKWVAIESEDPFSMTGGDCGADKGCGSESYAKNKHTKRGRSYDEVMLMVKNAVKDI
jgi:hypothetical protein